MSRNPLVLTGFLAVIAIAFHAAAPASAADDDAALDEARHTIAAKFDTIDPENVYASPIEGWYTLQKGSVVAYVTADGRYLMQAISLISTSRSI